MARDPKQPVDFRDWAEALAAAGLPAAQMAAFKSAVIFYLGWCKRQRTAASVASAQVYLAAGEPAGAREALRWFFKEALAREKAGDGKSSGVGAPRPPRSARPVVAGREALAREMPPPAAGDLGATPWEQRLVRAIRERHFQWRTEQTYRGWAERFARTLAPRTPEVATAADVREFLSALAVEGRVAVATQKQALNALVFLLREALGREVGDFGDFTRATPRRAMPVVLSREEGARVFAALEGTFRLMAA